MNNRLISIPATIAVSDFMRDLKAGSSKWIRQREPAFEWQRGFAAFTVNQSIVPDVDRYIANQEAHHAKQDFVGELKRLLELHQLSSTNAIWNDGRAARARAFFGFGVRYTPKPPIVQR